MRYLPIFLIALSSCLPWLSTNVWIFLASFNVSNALVSGSADKEVFADVCACSFSPVTAVICDFLGTERGELAVIVIALVFGFLLRLGWLFSLSVKCH